MNTDPLVSVVRGKPTDLETAALVTVLVAASSAVDVAVGAQPPAKKISSWARSARPSIGPRSWKGSALPR